MAEAAKPACGTVYLIGAGPGDPDLITRAGLSLLGNGVFVVDRLARSIIDSGFFLGQWSGREAEIIDVGKSPGGEGWTQDEINALLIAKAREGKTVVRLKGGDPFIFGRGVEEFRACREASVPCVVIPGLTSATSAATLAGIPLTLRGVAASFHVMAGHLGATPGDDSARWRQAARLEGTLVILMGVEALETICQGLLEGGMYPETPGAIIEDASLPTQRVTFAPLARLAAEANQAGVRAPAVIVIGEVVRHRLEFSSEGAPLRGKRVALTAPDRGGRAMQDRLGGLGAAPVPLPLIEYRDVCLDGEELSSLLRRARMSDFHLFTSRRAAESLRDLLRRSETDVRELGTGKVLAVGPATAQALRSGLNLQAMVLSDSGGGGALANCPEALERKRVLWLRGREARAETREILQGHGAWVDEAVLYESRVNEENVARLHEMLQRQALDAVLWFSPRGVEAGLGSLSEGERVSLTHGVCLAAIGKTTASALETLGLRATLIAPETTAESLIDALAAHFDPGWPSP